MTSSDAPALTLLLNLLQVYRESAAAYEQADRSLPDPAVAAELVRYHQQRVKLIQQAEQRVRDLRADPQAAGAETLLRVEIGVKVEGEATPTESALADLEQSEDAAVDVLKRGLKTEGIDAATRLLLEQHYELVQAAHDRVRQLRDRAATMP